MGGAAKRLGTILIKPAGPDCNMRCEYCFYLPKSDIFPSGKHRMSKEVLKESIRRGVTASDGQITFAWQGGEPTLMGFEFFRSAVTLQKELSNGVETANALQTNGLLLDRKWARFLAENDFLVGLSIDGPAHIHDRYRRLNGNKGSWQEVKDKAKLLMDEEVEVNALTVITRNSTGHAEEIYKHLKDLGFRYMQFIPCVEKDANDPSGLASFSVDSECFGSFLVTVFDLWMADFVDGLPTVFVRFFDSVFYRYAGLTPPDCTLQETCGNYLVVEHNGDVFPCDFFVQPDLRLGNVMEDNLNELLNSPTQKAFGDAKAALSEECSDCSWLSYCRGGCPYNRLNGGRDHLCAAYKIFFSHAHEPLKKLAKTHGF